MDDRMNLLLCLNQNLYRQMFVLLASIFQNNPAENIRLYVFETDFTQEQKDFLRKYVEEAGSTVEIYHILPEMMEGFSANSRSRIPLEAYCRLLAVDLLPQNMDRVLYLDVDIYVDKPLYTFYHTDFEGNYLCASLSPFYKFSYEEFVKIEDKVLHPHLNSGVMLLNLDKLRKDGYTIERFYRGYQEALAITRLKYPQRQTPYSEDQGTLNHMFGTKAKCLPNYCYNYRPDHFVQYGKSRLNEAEQTDGEYRTIIHFAGRMKPWRYWFETEAVYDAAFSQEYNRFIDNLCKRWWHYAFLSPFYAELKLEAKTRAEEYRNWIPQLREGQKAREEGEKFQKYSLCFLRLCEILRRDPDYVAKFFETNHYRNVAFYGHTMMADEFIRLLADSEIRVAYMIDNHCRTSFPTFPRNAANFPAADAIVVTDLLNVDRIQRKMKRYVSCPVVSVEEILKA